MSKVFITGIGALKGSGKEDLLNEFNNAGEQISRIKLSNEIEKLAVAGAVNAMKDALIKLPVGNDSVSIFAGIDEGIDSIKLRYYRDVLKEGPIGASPMLFPFTSPNAVSAQIAIALDIRGECITFSSGILSSAIAMGYAFENIKSKRTDIALAGSATFIDEDMKEVLNDIRYENPATLAGSSVFFILESDENARKRSAKIYGEVVWSSEIFCNDCNLDESRDHIMSVCVKETGIDKAEINTVKIISKKEKTESEFSVSFPMRISDFLQDKNSEGFALFVGIDCYGNVSAILVRKT